MVCLDSPEQVARVDGAAETLGVHVRPIYELIKILEILSLVTFSGGKRGKFTWRGTKFFLLTLGSMQVSALHIVSMVLVNVSFVVLM